jgi:hypothetical protein
MSCNVPSSPVAHCKLHLSLRKSSPTRRSPGSAIWDWGEYCPELIRNCSTGAPPYPRRRAGKFQEMPNGFVLQVSGALSEAIVYSSPRFRWAAPPHYAIVSRHKKAPPIAGRFEFRTVELPIRLPAETGRTGEPECSPRSS